MRQISISILVVLLFIHSSWASGFKPAIIYDVGGKFDKSYSEAAYAGAEKFKIQTGIAYRSFEIQNTDQREQSLRKFSIDGNNPIVVAGIGWAKALETVADEFPDVHFMIIDVPIERSNVKSVTFNEQEGAYIVGMLAAMASKSKRVGFIGGMDVPQIRRFGCGYVGGAKMAGAIDVIYNMTGDTPAAWSDPARGGEIAKSQMDQGADVIFAAAAGTGIGALQAAADRGKFGIGVDSNQNGLHPGHILTSMVKRVDVAVYDAFIEGMNGEFTAGKSNLGLKEGGVDYALDDNNKALITEEIKAKVEKAKTDIISGALHVHDYLSDNMCPY
ncbi:BMP family protein [Phyllobacterium sp. TAF24]|uniref:BMP family lipoprotein n=1 Tax=Phyllobacterium sp. TAF24 TaxID=3233068 RepID=UPI003F9A6DEA